eukprot:gene11270-12450_t
MPYTLKGESSDLSEAQSHGETYWEDEMCDDEESCMVERTNQGYKVNVPDIPSFYFKFICGRKNQTKSRIETETKTKISIPRPGVEGDVVVTGNDKNGVVSAKTRIELLVDSARLKQRPTHFISIPLACESTVACLEDFKNTVIEHCSECRGFDERIFQIPQKLHLTIGMMVLMSDKEIEKAGEFLQQLKDEITRKYIGSKPMHVRLEGVECMNDDPSEIAVLYAKVRLADGSDRLHAIAEFIVDSFVSKGLMKREYDRVKLHATVINTKFLNIIEGEQTKDDSSNRSHGQINKRSTFDARKVIQLCENFNFGETTVNSIHLSKRGTFGLDGRYFCERFIDV